ncbi:YneF family protein [Lactobacillus sp. PV034]|uniref:YneF family protein n=1 Tax=Lactobacillus sp. PV034 TaxID=2594495 RepID=UPI00224006C2|nr:YneF family protein [Lactobacillus sp. PV034]QNQ80315.1 YneF family protein [Lactobacillus sp. PV034]
MNIGLAILLIIIALLIGLIAGFYGARAYMKKYFQDNPPISEDMIVAMMSQMGQKPSAKKVNQVMNMMKHQQRK